jgi:hypothetical protein
MRHGRRPRAQQPGETSAGLAEVAPAEVVADGLAPAEEMIEGVAPAPAEEAATAEEPAPAPAQPSASWDDDTAVRRRLAAIYLRTGSFAAAQAELESLGGRNLLDGDGLLDLAEIRWRSGDRAGAGQAAGTYLDAGGEDGLAFVIVAEVAAEAGRQEEARGHLAEAAARMADLVRAYAGMRSFVELAPTTAEAAAPTPEASSPSVPDWFAPAEPRAHVEPLSGAAAEPAPEPEPYAAAERAAAVDPEVAAGSAVLAAGNAMLAAVHFGLALRTGPGSAEAVLAAIGDSHDPAIELARGDALRLLGRDDEAARAYLSAADALAGGGTVA